jgi:Na+-driven multidrug efflux pump
MLNGVLIFGWLGAPKLGIRGVAIATSIARGIELLWCMLDAHRGKFIRLKLSALIQKDRLLTKDYIRISLPALSNYLVWGGAFSMYSAIMGHLGTDIVAANSIISVIRDLAVIIGTGIGSGGAILIGKELGEAHFESAKRYGSILCRMTLIAGIAGGFLLIITRPLAMKWAGLSPLAQEYLGVMIWINSYYCIGKCVNSSIVAGILGAGGDTKFGLVCDAVVMWLISIPMAMLLGFVFHMPPMIVYFAISLDEFIKMPFVIKRYRQYKWLHNITRETKKGVEA